ncbi:MAG TPA: DnaD domain protein [Candidatus Alectryocaccomicrobium excrementavium]|uniref:DnaD domain protein n=1 Tax=Candidatus Alectryocaccomicrobium excrementavium TaxID=2840668 RepID=A0A9D1G0Q2_9FIRM|nr:DnaD domain protein [Candidatus Alectryocaccomicrobium excrementavium]
MQFASFAEETVLFGATAVENEFIMEYMLQAPGDFVRVYLYMLFQCQYPQRSSSPAEAARMLGISEDDFLRAMRYWERQGLWRRVADNPPQFQFVGCRQTAMDDVPRKNRELHARLQSILGEEYVIQPRDFSMIADWQEVFGLPAEVVILLVEHEVRRTHEKKRSLNAIFKRMDKIAHDWAENGVVTVEKAKERIARDSAGYALARRVARQFSLHRDPTVDEAALADRWANEMKLTEEDVLAACAETVRARNPSFAYLDSILRRHAGGAGVQADIQDERKRVETLKSIYAELGVPGAPAPAQLKTFTDFLGMGFQADTLVEAARRCARAGMRDFAAWEKYVNQCAQKGLFTLEALRESTRRIDELSAAAEKVMRTYGDDRRAGNADRAWIEKWLAAMPMDVILLAAERSQGTQLPRKYMGKLLSSWQKKGIQTVEQAQKEEPVVRMDTAKPQAGKAIQDYAQREYRDEDFAVDAVMQMWMEEQRKNDAQ